MKGWKLFVAGILLGLLLSGLFRLVRIPDNAQSFTLVTTTPDLTPKPSPTLSQIKVHVAGEVKVPGVYTLPDGATIQDAIEVAQGPTQKARADLLNLAAPLTDGQRIYIPSAEDAQSAQENNERSLEINIGSLVNINTASKEELESLPGIGNVRAEAIIAYRTQNGYFLAIEDLMKVDGIGQATFEALKHLITISP
ncbi:MAG: helix-hairpin-helix domain-containing protein [Anaerolineaceae bacterium]|jgi:competence protein ComEA|nr:helix-hairpin-helix domain-containing protein [Anaerolineaceae bacterium]MDD4043370.1 helix-hairpin-helix domain-containing protein [Anaerolineaceae bacterium]